MLKKSRRILTLAMAASVGILAPTVLSAPAAAHSVAADPAVIREWNVITGTTMNGLATPTPVPLRGLYYGFVSIAMHDAVVAVKGGYEPYNDVRKRANRGASPEVAAATAAYVALRHFFPTAAATLADQYAENLSDVRRNGAYWKGVKVGKAAANAIIRDRRGDGRDATVTFDRAPAPGVWRLTPPETGFAAIQMAFIRPLALKSVEQFELKGPPALNSKQYTKDFREVKAYGKDVGSKRSQAQSDTALFWNADVFGQYNGALRDSSTRHGYGIAETARAFAVLNTSFADTQIACWREKFEHAFWRPNTAIRLADTDGNRRTQRDPNWTPFQTQPPYPEYPSGHACATGASSETFSHLFGRRSIDMNVTHPTMPTRHFDTAKALDKETMNARIWLGFHFRFGMTDGNKLGHKVADWINDRYFEPTRR